MSAAEREALVATLFESMGGQAMVDGTLESTFETMKTTMLSDMPDEFWSELRKLTLGDSTVARIWQDSLTRAFEPDELQLLIDFYSAPHGRKMAATLPRMAVMLSTTILRWESEVLMPRLAELTKKT